MKNNAPYSIEQRDSELRGSRAAIRYNCYFDLAPQHLLRVEMEVDAVPVSQGDVILVLPVWLPGSYKIREFSGNVGSFRATDRKGNVLPHEWITKNRVQISGVTKSFTASYTYFAFERGVQQSHVTRWHAFLNPGNCCFYVDGRMNEVHHMTFHHTQSTNWKQVSTSLSPINTSGRTFGALNYDILVDSPVEIGSHVVTSFTLHGARHDVAFAGMLNIEPDWVVTQLKAVVEQGYKLFRKLPYDRYLFLIQFYPKCYGGLEHARSHVALYDSDSLGDKAMPGKFLSLLTHEFFHLWNVKRIRPIELGPFDYNREQYSSMLYLAEGATAYYDDLMSYRCGFQTESDYLTTLGEQHLQALADIPGRLATSIKESSFLAWVKLYLPTADLNNRYVSYYLKGGVLWWLLDLHMLAATNGKRRLDDGMRALMRRYSAKPSVGITEDEMISILSKACGLNVGGVLRKWINGHGELPTESLLKKFGLSLVGKKPGDAGTFGEKRANPTQPVDWFMGLITKEASGTLQVGRVFPDSPAERAGLGADDELIAVNGARITTQKQWDVITKSARLKDSVEVVASSEGRVYKTTVQLKPSQKKYLVKLKKPTAEQKKLFAAWLKR